MIALGGAIGVGLFLGSAKALHQAGPGLIAAYAGGGVAVFSMMRALGELLVHRPVSGSFASYAGRFLGKFAEFATGWSYWLVLIFLAFVIVPLGFDADSRIALHVAPVWGAFLTGPT
ncbi:amino acid permease [Streptomyces decoyicus]|uniref:amino acid permease n=1 Tax=Streptomyces decoyicus TaxID=249567 RepID=UPI003637A60F